MIRIGLMVCAAFMLWASSATAQKAVGPCTADELRLCTGPAFERTSTNSQMRACCRLLGSLRLTKSAGRASTKSVRASNPERAASRLA